MIEKFRNYLNAGIARFKMIDLILYNLEIAHFTSEFLLPQFEFNKIK